MADGASELLGILWPVAGKISSVLCARQIPDVAYIPGESGTQKGVP